MTEDKSKPPSIQTILKIFKLIAEEATLEYNSSTVEWYQKFALKNGRLGFGIQEAIMKMLSADLKLDLPEECDYILKIVAPQLRDKFLQNNCGDSQEALASKIREACENAIKSEINEVANETRQRFITKIH